MSAEIRKDGKVVAVLDREYTMDAGTVTFEDMVVKGDMTGTLAYGGRSLVVEHVHALIGLEVTMKGARGPVWKGVRCRVLPQ